MIQNFDLRLKDFIAFELICQMVHKQQDEVISQTFKTQLKTQVFEKLFLATEKYNHPSFLTRMKESHKFFQKHFPKHKSHLLLTSKSDSKHAQVSEQLLDRVQEELEFQLEWLVVNRTIAAILAS